MAEGKQISVSIPTKLAGVLQKISEDTGKSQSSLCASWIEDGLYSEIEKQNKLEVYLRMQEKEGLKGSSK